MSSLALRLSRELADWRDRLPPAWRPHLPDGCLSFQGLPASPVLPPENPIWPQEGAGPRGAHVFKALRDLPPTRVRVVIFGNDPYTRLAQATGRSFEQGDLTDWRVDLRVPRRVSPSLASIVAAALHAGGTRVPGLTGTRLQSVLRGMVAAGRPFPLPPPHRVFSSWARQGVLWLNRTLTFSLWDDEHRAAHRALWDPFTREVIRVLLGNPRLVIALWGAQAKSLQPLIEDLRREHPRPGDTRFVLAGHPQMPRGFFADGNPLVAINRALGGRRIDWS